VTQKSTEVEVQSTVTKYC